MTDTDNVVDVDFNVKNVTKNEFHDLLSNVGFSVLVSSVLPHENPESRRGLV